MQFVRSNFLSLQLTEAMYTQNLATPWSPKSLLDRSKSKRLEHLSDFASADILSEERSHRDKFRYTRLVFSCRPWASRLQHMSPMVRPLKSRNWSVWFAFSISANWRVPLVPSRFLFILPGFPTSREVTEKLCVIAMNNFLKLSGFSSVCDKFRCIIELVAFKIRAISTMASSPPSSFSLRFSLAMPLGFLAINYASTSTVFSFKPMFCRLILRSRQFAWQYVIKRRKAKESAFCPVSSAFASNSWVASASLKHRS